MARPKQTPKRKRDGDDRKDDDDDGKRSPLQHLSELATVELVKADLRKCRKASDELESCVSDLRAELRKSQKSKQLFESKLVQEETRNKKFRKTSKEINEELRKQVVELEQQYKEAVATNKKNGAKYEALLKECEELKSSQPHMDLLGYDADPKERHLNGPISGDIILWVKLLGPTMGGDSSQWERALPYVLLKQLNWKTFKCTCLTRNKDGQTVNHGEETIDVSSATWKFLKTNGPVNGKVINLMKAYSVGVDVSASYPQWENGVEDPVILENTNEEEFSPAVITFVDLDRAFIHFHNKPWEYFAEVGIERLIKPFPNSESNCHVFKDAHEHCEKMKNIPPNCRGKDADRIIRATLGTGDIFRGEWELCDDGRVTKYNWEASLLVNEDTQKVLHATFDRGEHRESATLVLCEFKKNEQWIEFIGKSTSKRSEGIEEAVLIGATRGDELYIQLHIYDVEVIDGLTMS